MAGDYIAIMDSSQPVVGTDNRVTSALVGEYARIRSIDSGSQMTLHSLLTWDFTAWTGSVGTTVRRMQPMTGWHVEGIHFQNPLPLAQPGAAYVFQPAHGLGVDLIDCKFSDLDGPAFRPQQCVRVRVRCCDFSDCHSDDQTHLDGTTGLAYPIAIAYCHDTIVTDCMATRCRHMVTTIASTAQILGRHLLVSDCIARDMIESSFDCHAGFDHITFVNCHAHNAVLHATQTDSSGFQIRGPRVSVLDCSVDGHGNGVRLDAGADDAVISGNRFINVTRGVMVVSSNNAYIINNVIKATVAAVSVGDWSSWTNYITRLNIDKLYVQGSPSTAVLDFSTADGTLAGRWANTFHIGEVQAPDAGTLTAGRSNYTITSAATITIPETSDVFHVTGTTGITNAVAGRPGRQVSLIFDGICTLTTGAAWVIQGSPHITVANEVLHFACDGGVWRQLTTSSVDSEMVQDIVAGMVTADDPSPVVLTYNDATGKLNIDVSQGTLTSAAGVELSYDDVTHTMTIGASGISASSIVALTSGSPRTLLLTDAGKFISINTAGTYVLNVPTHANVAFPVGTRVDIVSLQTSSVLVGALSGVALLSTPGANLRAQYSAATLVYMGDVGNVSYWLLTGDLSA